MLREGRGPGIAHVFYSKTPMPRNVFTYYKNATARVLSVRHPIIRFLSAYQMFTTKHDWFGKSKMKEYFDTIAHYVCHWELTNVKYRANLPTSCQGQEFQNYKDKMSKDPDHWISINHLAIFMFTKPKSELPPVFVSHMSSQYFACFPCNIPYDYIIKVLTMAQDWGYLSNPEVNERKNLFKNLNQTVDFGKVVNHEPNGLGIDVSKIIESTREKMATVDEEIKKFMLREFEPDLKAFGYRFDIETNLVSGLLD